MLYAATNHERGNTAGVAAGMVELERVSLEAEAAGDIELAEAIESHLSTVQRSPGLGAGRVTLHLRSGRRVPLDAARQHIRGGAQRPRATGDSPLAREMQAISAQCRAITSAIDQQRIASVLANTGPRCTRADEAEFRCDFCGEDSIEDCFC